MFEVTHIAQVSLRKTLNVSYLWEQIETQCLEKLGIIINKDLTAEYHHF